MTIVGLSVESRLSPLYNVGLLIKRCMCMESWVGVGYIPELDGQIKVSRKTSQSPGTLFVSAGEIML